MGGWYWETQNHTCGTRWELGFTDVRSQQIGENIFSQFWFTDSTKCMQCWPNQSVSNPHHFVVFMLSECSGFPKQSNGSFLPPLWHRCFMQWMQSSKNLLYLVHQFVLRHKTQLPLPLMPSSSAKQLRQMRPAQQGVTNPWPLPRSWLQKWKRLGITTLGDSHKASITIEHNKTM